MEEDQSEVINPLPPILYNNPRQRVDAEKISLHKIYKEKHKVSQELKVADKKPPQPVPLFPLHLSFAPDHLCFDLDEETVIIKLRVWNPGDRTIYAKLCGLWDDSARLGASWWCYPKTRFLLIPGFSGIIYIKSTPRESSPIPFAHIALQVAASHLRDNVVGYFEIPLFVKFLKYVPPGLLEE